MLRRLLVLAALGAATVGAWPYALRIPQVRETVEGVRGFVAFFTQPPETEYVTVGPTRVITTPIVIEFYIRKPAREGIGDTTISATNTKTGETKRITLPGLASNEDIQRAKAELKRQLLGN